MKKVVIFYIPFNADTYVPVTVESIEKMANCKFTLDHAAEEVHVLKDAIESSSAGAFDNRVVRLKAIGVFAHAIYVDIDGGMLYERSNKQRKLSEEGFNVIKSLMKKLSKQQRCELGMDYS